MTAIVERARPGLAAPPLPRPEAALPPRLALVPAGFLPVSLIAASAFGVAGLRVLALGVLLPVLVVEAVVVDRHRSLLPLVGTALILGAASTALYDAFRFQFLWFGLMHRDPIPHIGVALGLHPAWLFGYLWRYLGNGGGLAVAFVALGFRGVRAGVLYGLFVCAGLLVTLAVAPYGQQMLFPLNVTTVVMATGGHAIYGAALGTLVGRSTRTRTPPAGS